MNRLAVIGMCPTSVELDAQQRRALQGLGDLAEPRQREAAVRICRNQRPHAAPGAAELIMRLRTAGIPVALLTDLPSPAAATVLEQLRWDIGVEGFVDAVISPATAEGIAGALEELAVGGARDVIAVTADPAEAAVAAQAGAGRIIGIAAADEAAALRDAGAGEIVDSLAAAAAVLPLD